MGMLVGRAKPASAAIWRNVATGGLGVSAGGSASISERSSLRRSVMLPLSLDACHDFLSKGRAVVPRLLEGPNLLVGES